MWSVSVIGQASRKQGAAGPQGGLKLDVLGWVVSWSPLSSILGCPGHGASEVWD